VIVVVVEDCGRRHNPGASGGDNALIIISRHLHRSGASIPASFMCPPDDAVFMASKVTRTGPEPL
jgi:hypothetical protein